MLKEAIYSLIPLLVLLGQISLLLGIIFYQKIKPYSKYFLKFALLVALVSMLGSLFYSEIMEYAPCSLCWYQRICMYPLVIILSIAILKKSKEVFNFVAPLSIVGIFLSTYHYISQITSTPTFCSINDATSCSVRYVTYFGYITIPLMALTGFVVILSLTYFYNKK